MLIGEYPASMREYLGDRLPTITPEEKQDFLSYPPDFLGYNHYTSIYVANDNSTHPANDGAFITSPYNATGHLIGPQAASSWLYVYPAGFNDVLQWVYTRYRNVTTVNFVMMITENGVDVPNENNMPLQQALQDTFRVQYLTDYINSLNTAIQAGVPVIGYFVWSLLDNFEWTVKKNHPTTFHINPLLV